MSPDNQIGARRSYTDPVWSPDSKALSVLDWHWEGSERVWFYPIRPVKDDEILIREGDMWSEAVWAPDSQSIYLSGLGYSGFSPLIKMSRDGKNKKVLIDGNKDNLYVINAFPVENGLIFFGVQGITANQ